MKKRKHPSELPFHLISVESPTGNRAARLEHLFFEELDRLFRFEVSDPRLQDIILMFVQVSQDLRNAKAMYAIKPEEGVSSEKEVKAGLAKAAPFLRARLAEHFAMKRVPELCFQRDRLAEASLKAKKILAENPPTTPAIQQLSENNQTPDESKK